MTAEPTTHDRDLSPAEDAQDEEPPDRITLIAFIAALTLAGILATLMITGHPGSTTNWLLAAGALVAASCTAWRGMRGTGAGGGYRRLRVCGRELFSYERGSGALPPVDTNSRNHHAGQAADAGQPGTPTAPESDHGDAP